MSTALPEMKWQSGPGMPQSIPRQGMPIVFSPVEHSLVGFGGSPTTLDDTWSFSVKDDAWSTLILGTVSPPGRTGHCAAYLPTQNAVLFVGGHDDMNGAQTTPLYFTVGTPSFTPLPSPAPMPMAGCAAAFDAPISQAVVFGGMDTRLSDDTWLFDPATQTFTLAMPPSAPSARRDASLVVDPFGDEQTNARLLLFGGLADDGEVSDVWLWDGTEWGELGTLEDPVAAQTNDDPRPLGRSGAAVAVDPTRRILYVFGGLRQGTYLDDLWRLDLANLTWTHLSLPGAPVGRAFASVAYDPNVDRVMIFGGVGDAGTLSDGWALVPSM
jgi:hypothetical protein